MKQLKLDAIGQKNRVFRNWGFINRILAIILLLVVGILVWTLWHKPETTSVFQRVLGKEESLKVDDGRVNVILLGVGGGRHEGADLTDTIIIVSYHMETKQVDLISIPRDLWLDEYKIKVNALYGLGKERGDGLEFVRKEIGEILGITIPYAIKIDFDGFIKAVDLVGGIDVDVQQSFDDYVYPIEGKENDLCGYKEEEVDIDEQKAEEFGVPAGRIKALLDHEGKIATMAAKPGEDIVFTDQQVATFFPCRFEHLSFKKGITHMDGATALKFVRSRHGTNGEGSDFARSRRQQLVLQAFKDKVLSIYTLTDPIKIINLVGTVGESIQTDIPQEDYIEFSKLAREVSKVESHVINGSNKEQLLINPPPQNYNGAWVLIPKNNDFSQIHQYVKNIFSVKESSESSAIQD